MKLANFAFFVSVNNEEDAPEKQNFVLLLPQWVKFWQYRYTIRIIISFKKNKLSLCLANICMIQSYWLYGETMLLHKGQDSKILNCRM